MVKWTLRPRHVPETETVGGMPGPPRQVERALPGAVIALGCAAIIAHSLARRGMSPPVGSQRSVKRSSFDDEPKPLVSRTERWTPCRAPPHPAVPVRRSATAAATRGRAIARDRR